MAMDAATELALTQMALTGVIDIIKALESAKSGGNTVDAAKATIDETVTKVTSDIAANNAMVDEKAKERFGGDGT